jgi:hypothetical protein
MQEFEASLLHVCVPNDSQWCSKLAHTLSTTSCLSRLQKKLLLETNSSVFMYNV